MSRDEQMKKAGRLQTASFVVFLFAALIGAWAFIEGSYITAAINVLLMIANFALYQRNSNIIRRLSTR